MTSLAEQQLSEVPAQAFPVISARCHAQRLGCGEVLRRELSGLSVRDNFIRYLLPLVEGGHACALNGTDVHKHILAAVIRLDESKSFLAIEPLNGSLGHLIVFFHVILMAARCAAGRRRVLGRSSDRRAFRGEANSFRPKLDALL